MTRKTPLRTAFRKRATNWCLEALHEAGRPLTIVQVSERVGVHENLARRIINDLNAGRVPFAPLRAADWKRTSGPTARLFEVGSLELDAPRPPQSPDARRMALARVKRMETTICPSPKN